MKLVINYVYKMKKDNTFFENFHTNDIFNDTYKLYENQSKVEKEL